MKGLLVALLLSTLIGAALGAGYARFFRTPPAVEAAADGQTKGGKTTIEHGKAGKHGADAGKDAHAKDGKAKDGAGIVAGGVALPAIVAALAAPAGMWLRIDSSIVVDSLDQNDLETLKRAISADIIAYVATLSLPQVQGSLGLQHLREDLEERVVLRSEGKAHSLFINGLVIQ